MAWQTLPISPVIRIEGEKSAAFNLARGRLVMLSAFFILGYVLIAIRVADLSLVQGQFSHLFGVEQLAGFDSYAPSTSAGAALRRGDILDRNGEVIATSLGMVSLYADPKLISDPDGAARALAGVFPDQSYAELHAKLSAEGRFVWLERNILPEQQQAVLAIGEPGLGFEGEDRRIYPQGSLFSHLLGYTNVDGYGLGGLEAGLHEKLASGESVALTLDLRLQHILRREIAMVMDEFSAKAGAGVIMNAKTGAVLAGVSLPDYDPHHVDKAENEQKFNRLTLGVFEMGSIFKIFSTALALESGNANINSTYDAREGIKIGRYEINDYHAEDRVMSLPEVFMHSSNIGTVLMIRDLGGQALKDFYNDLGLLTPLYDLGISEIGRPLSPQRWGEIETATISYGQGIATSPLQVAAAVASIVNDGKVVRPHLVPQETSQKHDLAVISPETSSVMRRLMRLTVTDGTGGNADVPGYMVGGKTGTADKPSARGGYDRSRRISSFVGAFPIDDPDYVVLVMVDEPKGIKKSYGYATAGWVAAPAAARIVSSMASVLGLPPQNMNVAGAADLDYAAPLRQYIAAEDDKGAR